VYDLGKVLKKYNLEDIYVRTWRKVVAENGWIQRTEGNSWDK